MNNYVSKQWLTDESNSSAESIICVAETQSGKDKLFAQIGDLSDNIYFAPQFNMTGAVTLDALIEYISKMEILTWELEKYCEALRLFRSNKFPEPEDRPYKDERVNHWIREKRALEKRLHRLDDILTNGSKAA